MTIQKINLPANQADLIKKTIAYEQASLSTNTLRSYWSMWKKFETWCNANNMAAMPASAETVAIYIASLGESVSFSTLDSTLAAIEMAHEKSGMAIKGDHSLYRRVRKGIRRTHKENQTLKQAPALTVLNLKVACCKLSDSIADCRDRAVLSLAFFGALRRSELASLDIDNLEFSDKGVSVFLLQSKTSDTKEIIYIAHAKDKDVCPVKAIKDWLACLEKNGIMKDSADKALFRSLLKGGKIAGRISGHGVSEIIKRHFGDEYSGHSARRGLATAAAEANTPIHILRKFGRWKGADMPLRYAECAKGFEDSAVAILGV